MFGTVLAPKTLGRQPAFSGNEDSFTHSPLTYQIVATSGRLLRLAITEQRRYLSCGETVPLAPRQQQIHLRIFQDVLGSAPR